MNKYTIIILLLLITIARISQADVLIIDRINQQHPFETPERGITMDQVLSQFGEPTFKKEAIGEPPITEWQYENFSVYFESKWVINSVVYKASAEEKGPKYINQSN